jgi:hypothetical protein
MGLSKFRDTLSPVILHFGGEIGDGSPCGEISLSADIISPTSPFDKRLYLHSRQGFIIVDLLDNFLNPLKLFWAVASNFTKSP